MENIKNMIYVDDLEHTEKLEGHWVFCTKYKWPIYIPKRDKNGVPILPAEWRDEDDE